MKKTLRIALSLIILGSASTGDIFGSLNIPGDPTGSTTPAASTPSVPALPPSDTTSNGPQPTPPQDLLQDRDKHAFPKGHTVPPPQTTTCEDDLIHNLMYQLSYELKKLFSTGGPSTARWEIDSKSLIRLIQVFEPQFNGRTAFGSNTTDASTEPPTFGFGEPPPDYFPIEGRMFNTGIGPVDTLEIDIANLESELERLEREKANPLLMMNLMAFNSWFISHELVKAKLDELISKRPPKPREFFWHDHFPDPIPDSL